MRPIGSPPRRPRVLGAVARAVSRQPWPVVAGWLVATGILLATAPPLREVATQNNSAFLSEDAPSVEGGTELARIWPEDELGNTGALVFRRAGGLTEQDEAFVRATEGWLRSPAAPDVVRLTQSPYSRPELRETLLSTDGTTALV